MVAITVKAPATRKALARLLDDSSSTEVPRAETQVDRNTRRVPLRFRPCIAKGVSMPTELMCTNFCALYVLKPDKAKPEFASSQRLEEDTCR